MDALANGRVQEDLLGNVMKQCLRPFTASLAA